MSSALDPVLRKLEELGKVVVILGPDGVSANLVGELSFSTKPNEILLEIKGCGCHVHISPSSFRTLHFKSEKFEDGEEPLVEFADAADRPVLRIWCPYEPDKYFAVRDDLQRSGG
jgi:hypothetical protein